MKEKDRILDSNLKAGIADLRLDDERKGFVEPFGIESVLHKHSGIKADAERRSKGFLFRLGLGNKELRNDIF